MNIATQLRIGHGIDVHPFAANRALVLGGVRIPYDRGLSGHSDADALLHALIDALLGAAGEGDIGTHFPDSDERWRDISSLELLSRVWEKLGKEGWQVLNLDCTILVQAPRLSPYTFAMKENIGKALGIDTSCCGIKVTTTEKLGFIGREEGILASCVVLMERGI